MAVIRPLYINTTTGELTRAGVGDQVFDSNFLTVTNPGVSPIPPGTPVKCIGASQVGEAQADSLANAKVIALTTETIADSGGTGVAQTDGRITLTTGEWDAVTGQVGGLTFGAKYYLDPASPGMMTTTPPSVDGQVLAPLGSAKSTTLFEITIGTRIVL